MKSCIGCGGNQSETVCSGCLLLLAQYREWSEDAWAAGFISPTPDTVREFRERTGPEESMDHRETIADFELEFLREWKRQEDEAQELRWHEAAP